MANYVMTMLEGQVPSARWAKFEARFDQLGSQQQPPQLVQGLLAQSVANPRPEVLRANPKDHGYLSTLHNQGVALLAALQILFAGQPLHPSFADRYSPPSD